METKSSHRLAAATFREVIHLPLAQRILPLLPSAEEAPTLTPERICLARSTLGLLTALVSADYGGCQSDGDSEEIEMAMLPSEWAPLLCDAALVRRLAALWGMAGRLTGSTQSEDAALATRAAETLLSEVSLRRSLFPSPEAAGDFYQAVYAALRRLLGGKHLENEEFHAIVAQLLAKFKVNVQLGEMAKFPEFPAFFQSITDFAANSLSSRGYLGDFAYSLLLWSRLLEAFRFTSAPIFSFLPEETLRGCVHVLCRRFVWTAVERSAALAGNEELNPLENVELLLRQRERVATLLTFDYEAVLEWTTSVVERGLLRLSVLLSGVRGEATDEARLQIAQCDRRGGKGLSRSGDWVVRAADGDDAAQAAVQRVAAARGQPPRRRLLRHHRLPRAGGVRAQRGGRSGGRTRRSCARWTCCRS